jgi:hypothetical protein
MCIILNGPSEKMHLLFPKYVPQRISFRYILPARRIYSGLRSYITDFDHIFQSSVIFRYSVIYPLNENVNNRMRFQHRTIFSGKMGMNRVRWAHLLGSIASIHGYRNLHTHLDHYEAG